MNSSVPSKATHSPVNLPQQEKKGGADWQEYYYAIKARSWIIVTFLMFSILWGIFSAANQHVKYAARSVLFIEQVKSRILSEKLEEVRDDEIKSIDMINTLVDLLQSYPFALRVVNRQKLAQDHEFLSAAGFYGSQTTPESAAGALVKMVRANYRLNTRLIDIFVTTRNPGLSVKLANAYPDEYFHYLNDKRLDATRSASSFLMEEADRLRQKMRASEEGMQNFRERERAASFESMLQEAQKQIIDLAASQSALQSKLTQINSDLEVAQANKGNAEELLHLPSVMADAKISTMVTQIGSLEDQFAVVQQRYRAKHPLYISIKTQIDLTKDQLSHRLSDVVGMLDSMKSSITEQQAADKVQREEAEKHLLDVTSKSIEYNDLKRELESDGALYSAVVGRIKEVDVTKELAGTPVQLQEAAAGAQAISQGPLVILFKAILYGFVMGVALVIALHKMDSTLKTVDQVEHFVGLPVVAAIPQIGDESDVMLGFFSKEQFTQFYKAGKKVIAILRERSAPLPKRLTEIQDVLRPVVAMLGLPHVILSLPNGGELVTKGDRSGAIAEAFRSLRASIAMTAHVENQRTFLFTSSVPSEGKSFCSANFAITLAHQGLKTLVIDGDLRKPTLSTLFFGRHRKPGLSEVLLGTSSLDHAVHSSEIEGLAVLTAGGRSSRPSELLSGQPFRELIAEALRHYDRVVIDSAPLLSVSDTLLIAPNVEVICLVVRAFMTPRRLVNRALKNLAEAHLKPAGVVFNCLPSGNSYAYYYSGKYYGSYGSKGVYGS